MTRKPDLWVVAYMEDGEIVQHTVTEEPTGHYAECATPIYLNQIPVTDEMVDRAMMVQNLRSDRQSHALDEHFMRLSLEKALNPDFQLFPNAPGLDEELSFTQKATRDQLIMDLTSWINQLEEVPNHRDYRRMVEIIEDNFARPWILDKK